MASPAKDSFFDVLIDRLIVDVRRDFEANLREQRDDDAVPTPSDSIFDEPTKSQSIPYDDLVSKMIGFRTRLESIPTQSISPYQAPKKFEPRQFEIGMNQAAAGQANRKRAAPEFSSSAAQVAFTLVSKSGARFFIEDLAGGEILPEALKRERRRVLLTLHPDRVPEADRAQAHHSFLAAAEAFSVLAEFASPSKAA